MHANAVVKGFIDFTVGVFIHSFVLLECDLQVIRNYIAIDIVSFDLLILSGIPFSHSPKHIT